MRVLLVLCVVALSGCALIPTRAKYDAKLQKWVGREGKDLILKVGPPDRILDMDDGFKLMQYNDVQRSTKTELGYDGRSVSSSDTTKTCSTWFYTDKNGIITKYGFRGDSCESY